MNAPVATERKSFLPLRLRSTKSVGSSNIPTAPHPTTPVTPPMPLAVQNDTKSSLTVGDRVLVNGLKSGILRYIGSVKFAQGLFCGVELDEPEGKHDGQVNNVRYFQCKTNHGIFVPHDKVVLVSRERTYTTQRSISRLKPPILTRSMTISSSINNKNEKVAIKTSSSTVQLPDIIPSPSIPTQPVSLIKTISDPIITDHHEIITPTENTKPITQIQPLTIDEPPETIEADFIDSVSLILHQLQQEQQPFVTQPRPSMTISEEGTIDDDDEDDESIVESILSEKQSFIDQLSFNNNLTKSIQTDLLFDVNEISIQTDLSFDVNENITIMKNSLLNSKSTSLASSTTSLNKFKINPTENINKKKSILPTPTPTPVVKKIDHERKLSVPLANTLTSSRKPSITLANTSRKSSITLANTSRKSSLVPAKTGVSTITKSVTSLGSSSKLTQSPSSSNSVNSSQSDLTSNQQKSSNTTQGVSHSIDLSSNQKSDQTSDHQLMIQKVVIHSLESTNEYLKKQYQHLLNQFDLVCILSQYYINKNEQIKQEYEEKLSKIRIQNNQLKTSIEQIKSSHENELITLNKQNENQINSLKESHKQETIKYQHEIDKLLNEKNELETRCTTLQSEVDRFMEEMANSEHADPLLRRVEILEKDRNSLQTALELRTQDLTQLRTRFNEQTFQREDQLALQKRIDMVENRNQDLICLLRNWQLNEISAVVERDQLKEQLAQLERDNRLLIFENETLLYSLRQRSPTVSNTSISKMNFNSKLPLPNRAHSFPSIITITTPKYVRVKRSLSLNCILNR